MKTINNFEDKNGLELIRSVTKMFKKEKNNMTNEIKTDEITIQDGRYDVFSEQLRGALEILQCPNAVVTSSELIIEGDETIINTYVQLEGGEEVNGCVRVPEAANMGDTDLIMESLIKDIVAKCLTIVYTNKYFMDEDDDASTQDLFEDVPTEPVEVIKLFED